MAGHASLPGGHADPEGMASAAIVVAGPAVSQARAVVAPRGSSPAALGTSLLRPSPAWDLRSDPRRGRLGHHAPVSRVLDQPDDPVLIAVPTVDNARHVLPDVVEQVEIVTDKFHLQQGLVDRDRLWVVELLPDHERPVAIHLDRDQGLRAGVLLLRLGRRRTRLTRPGHGHGRGSGHASPAARPAATRAGITRPGTASQPGAGSRDSVGSRSVMVLPPVEGAPEPRIQLGKRQVEGRDLVLSRGFRPDRRAARPDGQLDALLLAGLAGVPLDR